MLTWPYNTIHPETKIFALGSIQAPTALPDPHHVYAIPRALSTLRSARVEARTTLLLLRVDCYKLNRKHPLQIPVCGYLLSSCWHCLRFLILIRHS